MDEHSRTIGIKSFRHCAKDNRAPHAITVPNPLLIRGNEYCGVEAGSTLNESDTSVRDVVRPPQVG